MFFLHTILTKNTEIHLILFLLQSTMELFVRQLIRRLALRLAEDLQPGKASTITSTYLGIAQQQQQQQQQAPSPLSPKSPLPPAGQQLGYSYAAFRASAGAGAGNSSRSSGGSQKRSQGKGRVVPLGLGVKSSVGGHGTGEQAGAEAYGSPLDHISSHSGSGNAAKESPWV
jgi:hypothetical protein